MHPIMSDYMIIGGKNAVMFDGAVGHANTNTNAAVTRHGFKTAMSKTTPNPLDTLTRMDYDNTVDKLRDGDEVYAVSVDR